jgi:uncharacterized membrane protein YadS
VVKSRAGRWQAGGSSRISSIDTSTANRPDGKEDRIMTSSEAPESIPQEPAGRGGLLYEMRTAEDWWSIWCAAFLLGVSFLAVWINRPADFGPSLATDKTIEVKSPLKPWLSKPGSWSDDPLRSFVKPATEKAQATNVIPGIFGAFLVCAALFGTAMQIRSQSGAAFLKAFPLVFLLAVLAYVLAGQSVIKAYNLEYALWALLVGLIICNTVGTPEFLKPAVMTEFYIKTGLVLLGAEVLMNRLLALGVPGVFVSWVVTPITLIGTYLFGQKVLKISSRSLNMVISADMSVCGVSAAIATAAACKAKKEELTLAVGISLIFTVVMMVVMPAFIKAVGMDPIVAGAWLGGTIDSTGAVAAAGAALGQRSLEVAATVKMIQNILIGVVAFFVALYWVSYVERDETAARPGLTEIWLRFPKFVLGFVLASVVFSVIYGTVAGGPELVDAMIGGSTKTLRGWFFCLAFVSIGLETNFREMAPFLKGGKPLTLYVCGQTLNLSLSLAMSYLMFRVVFPDWVK